MGYSDSEAAGQNQRQRGQRPGRLRPVYAGGHSGRVAQCADQYRQPEEQGAGRGLPQEGRGASGEGSALADQIYQNVLSQM